MNTKSFLTLAVASSLSLLPISPARGQVDAITNISKAGTNITITWNNFGPGPPYVYTVEYTSDFMTAPWTQVTPATSPWTDVGVLSTEAIRFYRVAPNDPGGERTFPVGFVKVEALANECTMMSVPLLWSPPGTLPDMRLADPAAGNLPIGDMLADALPPGGGLLTAPSIFKDWDPVLMTYREKAFLDSTTSMWRDEAGSVSGMSFGLGEGFWLYTTTLCPNPATIVFLGWVPMDATISVTLVKGWTMFNWPYPTTLELKYSTLRHVGVDGDMVFEWNPTTGTYTTATLAGGRWLDSGGGLSTITFVPGTAKWYLRMASNAVVWFCTRPY